jgi:hypothetical protein
MSLESYISWHIFYRVVIKWKIKSPVLWLRSCKWDTWSYRPEEQLWNLDLLDKKGPGSPKKKCKDQYYLCLETGDKMKFWAAVGEDNTRSGMGKSMYENHVLKLVRKFICAGDCTEVTPMILLTTMTKTIKLLLPSRRVVEIGCKLGGVGVWLEGNFVGTSQIDFSSTPSYTLPTISVLLSSATTWTGMSLASN